MKKYFKLMRIHHYLKNGLIFLPLIFSGKLFNIPLLTTTLFGLVAFCLTASIVYIVNDIKDIENDKKHPSKCKRPLATGQISINQAYLLIGILTVMILGCNYLGGNKPLMWMYLIVYLGINILYSFGGKNIALLDVTILVSGFLIRVLYGAIITNLTVSSWMYLTVMTMSFYLGLGKRRNEMAIHGNNSREVLKQYNFEFLDKNMYMCLGLTLTFYSLWCVDVATIASYGTNKMMWTIPLVMLICMRYSLIIEGNSEGDPVDIINKDKMLQILIGVYMSILFFVIYL